MESGAIQYKEHCLIPKWRTADFSKNQKYFGLENQYLLPEYQKILQYHKIVEYYQSELVALAQQDPRLTLKKNLFVGK